MKPIKPLMIAALLVASTIPANAGGIYIYGRSHTEMRTKTVPTTHTSVSYTKGNRDQPVIYSARQAFLHPTSIGSLAGPATRNVTVTHGTKTVSYKVTCRNVYRLSSHPPYLRLVKKICH